MKQESDRSENEAAGRKQTSNRNRSVSAPHRGRNETKIVRTKNKSDEDTRMIIPGRERGWVIEMPKT